MVDFLNPKLLTQRHALKFHFMSAWCRPHRPHCLSTDAACELRQRHAGGDQAHSAGDIRSGDGGNGHVLGGCHDAADGRDAPGVKIRCRTGFAYVTLLPGHGKRCERHELAYRFFLKRKTVRQEH